MFKRISKNYKDFLESDGGIFIKQEMADIPGYRLVLSSRHACPLSDRKKKNWSGQTRALTGTTGTCRWIPVLGLEEFFFFTRHLNSNGGAHSKDEYLIDGLETRFRTRADWDPQKYQAAWVHTSGLNIDPRA